MACELAGSLLERFQKESRPWTGRAFNDAGWDLVGETANGTEDIWWILEGKGYPRLWWEAAGESPP